MPLSSTATACGCPHVDSRGVGLASSSIRSSATIGTRNRLPILMTGSSPRRAASYAALRLSPKYSPASGTEIVFGGVMCVHHPLVAVGAGSSTSIANRIIVIYHVPCYVDTDQWISVYIRINRTK